MNKFDTHGGYFAPTGYFKVNTGGSHDENPNGGVQIGVDQQGVPNMLEEGEPVYNDYVFSDNIKADEDILAKNNIPAKYAGRLYSEIADAYVDEAEERPLDPISNNGLNEMLVRLSQAQEEQKQIQQRQELEDELASMSPEELAQLDSMLADSEQTDMSFADGGMINRFNNGGWENFLASLADYKNSLKKGRIAGTYAIDSGFPLAGYKTIKDLENSEGYKNFTNYILNHSDEQKVQDYLKALDAGVAKGVTTLFDGDTLRKGWEDIFRRRRNDGKGGIYHFSGDDLNALNRFVAPTLPPVENKITLPLGASSIAPQTMLANPHLASPMGKYVSRTSEYDDEQEPDSTEEQQVSAQYPLQPTLATFPRYAGALMNGALGVYNALQEPDRYSIRRYNPVLPSGRMQLVDPVYNPIDENMAVNDVLANSAATSRAIANSGLGPSTGAALLAADYNAGRNIGAARTQVWDANNQRRNNVIAQRNANGQALGNFNYGISRDRAQIINDARLRNIQNEFAQQRMNYAAEGEKYAALGNQISNINAALYGIGTENVRLNSINSNPAYDWVRMPDGNIYYMPKRNSGSNGGVLLKKYNK